MSDAERQAQRLLRRIARDSNLLLATRPFSATPAGHPVAVAAEALARRLGALPAHPASPRAIAVDVVTGEATLGGAPLRSRPDADARLDWAAAHMPVSRALAAELADGGAARGLRIGVAMTLEPKTATLALLLREAGAELSVYAHPDETDPAVAAALRARGLTVDADATLTGVAERDAALGFLGRGLDVLMDDGSHLIRLAHEALPDAVAAWVGATEETTSGLTPLRAMERAGVLRTGVMAVNDAATKSLFDNRYGTAQSCVFAIADLLDAVGGAVCDQPTVVVGYGPVGQGVAAYLAALGAAVTVVERDAVRALQAIHDGFPVASLADAAPAALLVSATGVPGTLPASAVAHAAVVAVAGGVPGEVDAAAIASATQAVAPHVDRLPHGGLLLAKGGCINVVAAEGNPIEIMDLSFATQLAALAELLDTRPGTGVHPLSEAAVARVAREASTALGVPLGAAPPAPTEHGEVTAAAAPDWRSPRYVRGGTS